MTTMVLFCSFENCEINSPLGVIITGCVLGIVIIGGVSTMIYDLWKSRKG